MIDYSIKKPHALCGHFVKINTQEEYDELKAIAEGCGFGLGVTLNAGYYHFNNNMAFDWMFNPIGQQITMSELRQLAELSKIEFPCEIEVSDGDDYDDWWTKTIVDFYKGQPVAVIDNGTYITYKHFRLGLKAKRKAELFKIIDDAKKELEEIEEAKV